MPGVLHLPGNHAGTFTVCPDGVILHGTRSGQPFTIEQEFDATVRYVAGGAGGLGWNATVGEGIIALHLEPGSWGWNARDASRRYLAVEFAQARLGDRITDSQVETFAWWFRNVARGWWPDLQPHFISHSELPEGKADGKTDPYPVGHRGNDELRRRILAAI